MKGKRLLSRAVVLALLLGALLTGCAPSEGRPLTEYAPEESQRLVIYTSHKEEVWWPIVKEFEERTGIWVDVVEGGTNELLEQIAQERETPRADVMFGGGVESLEAYRDCFTPYTCGEADSLREDFRAKDDLWTPFSSLPVVLIYNTKLVDHRAVTRWRDLLSPVFRGRIAFADPAISGSCFTGLVTMMYALGGDMDQTLQDFAANLEGRQMDSSGDVLTSVAGGTDWVGVTLEETALKRIAAGDDIALIYPADGTSLVPDGSALVQGAPHEENAKRFLDFTVSREVQQLLTDQFYRRSVRSDVEPLQTLVNLEDIPVVNYDVGWASSRQEQILMDWAFYLGREETV